MPAKELSETQNSSRSKAKIYSRPLPDRILNLKKVEQIAVRTGDKNLAEKIRIRRIKLQGLLNLVNTDKK